MKNTLLHYGCMQCGKCGGFADQSITINIIIKSALSAITHQSAIDCISIIV